MRGKRICGLILLLAICLLPPCAGAESAVEETLMEMTLHEKVCQLFFVGPEQFTRLTGVRAASQGLRAAFGRFPVGGVILFRENMGSADTLRELNAAMQTWGREAAHGVGLLIGVDEEGGSVANVAIRYQRPDRPATAAELGAAGDPEAARQAGETIGTYLAELGFNLDFAPVADVRADVPRPEIVKRSYSDDPQIAAAMVDAFVRGLGSRGVGAVLKHFPGHGAVSGNTHDGAGYSNKTLDEWRACDFLPFRAGLEAGAGMVMMSHQTARAVDPERPASLSPVIVGLLRQELGFDGVIITDALRMSAVSGRYGSGEACVLALEAGCDMLLLPYNFTNGYNGVMKALAEGRLTEARIDESVRRILRLKEALIPAP